jgi:hypothetical protein
MHTIFWLEKLKGRDHLEDTGVDGRMRLEWILRKQDVKGWTECIWFRTGACVNTVMNLWVP